GYCLFLQGRFQEAFDAFYKATWSESEQEKSFYYLSTIKTIQRDYDQALDFIENSLLKNLHNLKARGLKTILLRKMGRSDEAKIWAEETNTIDPFDLLALNERKLLSDDTVRLPFTIRPENFNFVIEAASDYASYGCYKEAIDLLDRLEPKGPMIRYSLAYYYFRMGDLAESQKQLKSASESDPSYCFPNRIEDIAVLNFAITQNPDDSYVYYYLGNLYYDKKQYQKALTDWKKSTELNDRFATSWRNLAIILWNKEKKPQEAIAAMEKAFSLDPNDARILFESDQLYKKANYPIHDRLENLEKHQSLLEKRDDLYTEYITLLNLSGQYEKALEKISGHIFHPWEGGEGKITSQYKIAHLEMAKKALVEKNSKEAERLLLEALTYPLNLGEGKLIGTKDNDIYYFLGCCYEQACDEDKAVKAWIHACKGSEEISGEMYYYDQPADMILYQGLALFKLTHYERSDLKFHKLIYYGEQHMEDTVTMDYFAVSLPDMQLLEEDLSLRNRAHCHYLIGLGNLGLRNWEKASDHFKETLKINNSHVGANIHLALSNTAKSNQFFEKKW
ncbi:MAG TPA: tetratricopeptide repeat protein, partial [Flexilinea sp.]|nr:tetratricopeptide repeat protein [Flexilinea sp.]